MSAWATWANALTASRLLLALPCALAAASGRWRTTAALLALAVATDLLDGPLARRLHQTSPLGGLFDHGTDALFVALLLAGLAAHGLVPALLPSLVVAAFLQYALDSHGHRGRPLRASPLGRYNGIAYFVLAALVVAREAFALAWPGDTSLAVLAWGLVVTTLVSMADRLLASLSRR